LDFFPIRLYLFTLENSTTIYLFFFRECGHRNFKRPQDKHVCYRLYLRWNHVLFPGYTASNW